MNPESLDLESSYFLVYLFSLEHYNCKCVTISHSVMPNSLWPKDCSLPSISVYGILQARILKWVVILSPGLADSLHLSHQGSPKILSVQFSHPVVSNCLLPHGVQHIRAPCPSPTPRVYSNSCPLSQRCYLTISCSVTLFSFSFNLSHHQGLFQWVGSSHQVAKVLELQHQSFQWIFRVDFL